MLSIPSSISHFHIGTNSIDESCFDITRLHFYGSPNHHLYVVAIMAETGILQRIWNALRFDAGILRFRNFTAGCTSIQIIFGNVKKMRPKFFTIILNVFTLRIKLLYQIYYLFTKCLAIFAILNILSMAHKLLHITSVFRHYEKLLLCIVEHIYICFSIFHFFIFCKILIINVLTQYFIKI